MPGMMIRMDHHKLIGYGCTALGALALLSALFSMGVVMLLLPLTLVTAILAHIKGQKTWATAGLALHFAGLVLGMVLVIVLQRYY